LIQDAAKARRKVESSPLFETLDPLAEPMDESPEAQICSAFNDPDSRNVLERFQRYASLYDRQYYQALHELQRLQAQRRGQKVVPPVAVHVTVDDPTTSG
jgi:hypothetical protein